MPVAKTFSRRNKNDVGTSRLVRKTERAVRAVGGKIETNPRLMRKSVRYPVIYKGKKYYVRRTGEHTIELERVSE